MEQIIKQYLDELAEKDQLFKEKYKPDHLEWCIKYLYRQAKFIAEQTKSARIALDMFTDKFIRGQLCHDKIILSTN